MPGNFRSGSVLLLAAVLVMVWSACGGGFILRSGLAQATHPQAGRGTLPEPSPPAVPEPPAAIPGPALSGGAEGNPGPAGQKPPDGGAAPEVRRVTLAAVGDVLIHSSIYKDARTSRGYDFRPMLARVKPYLEEADIAMANQESMIGGEELGLSDYPRFNSPFEIGDALKEAGIDVVNLANNHTLDGGPAAVLRAIGHWKQIGMMYIGAFASAEDEQTLRIMTKNGITLSFLSYTYGTNGISVPRDKPYLVSLIDGKKVAADIARARQASDAVIVNVHFGTEYEQMPNSAQRRFAQLAADAGAAVIIGHHPHVLQPAEWVRTPSGDRAFVIYSLGNFLAGQEGARERTGGILQLDLLKTVQAGRSRVTVENPRFLPTWISRIGWRHYQVLPLAETPATQLSDVPSRLRETEQHLTQRMPELRFMRPGEDGTSRSP